jgi:predicted component of type VI protein secretion system
LRGALQGNDKLDELLMDAASDTEKLDRLKKELGTEKNKGASDE